MTTIYIEMSCGQIIKGRQEVGKKGTSTFFFGKIQVDGYYNLATCDVFILI